MADRPKISLCMIVRDESANLRACLEPVRDLFDEMIVVDTGSTDDTRQIATELGARVVDFAWCDDFSAARNCSLDHATGDYVFWLDADDRIDAANHALLRQLFATLDGSLKAFVMQTQCTFWHPAQGTRIIDHVRLFRRIPEARYFYRAHEQIVLELQARGCALHKTEIAIHHVGYEDQPTHHRKALRDLRLLKMDYASYPEDPVVSFQLGQTYLRLDDVNDALTYLLRSLKYVRRNHDWCRKLYQCLVTAFTRLGRASEALSIAAQGLHNFPFDAPLLMQYAELCMGRGDMLAAEQALRRLLSHQDQPYLAISADTSTLDKDARRTLASIYRAQGRYSEAEASLQQLLSEDPEFTYAWVSLGYLYLDQRHLEQVRLTAKRVERCPFGPAYALCLLAEVAKVEGRFNAAIESLEKAKTIAPNLLLVQLVRLEVLVASGASASETTLAAHEVLARDPCNDTAQRVLASMKSATPIAASLSSEPVRYVGVNVQ